MEFNKDLYFAEAQKRGITPFQISYGLSEETSVSIYNDEVEEQTIGSDQIISAKGLFDGKVGSFSTDSFDSDTPSLIAKGVLDSALYGKEEKKENFFDGKKEYKTCESKISEFKDCTLKELRELGLKLSKEVKALDDRIDSVTVNLSKVVSYTRKVNDLGLDCFDECKGYSGSITLVTSFEGEPKTAGRSFKSFTDLKELENDARRIIPLVLADGLDFFKSKACASASYKCVLSYDCVASLLSFILGQFSAKAVKEHLSLFEGKLNEKIFSSCLTIKNTPHVLSFASSSYDAEGYPTCDFTVIEKGVLKDYYYALETARDAKRESNGCATGNSNSGPKLTTVECGDKSLEELFKLADNGIYLTDISGLNSGINGQTLEFSLPCQGYLIENGKKTKAVSMILCAGNLKDLFNNVLAVGNEEHDCGGIITPAILIDNLAISGQ